MLFVFAENDEDLRDKFDIFKRRRKEHSIHVIAKWSVRSTLFQSKASVYLLEG